MDTLQKELANYQSNEALLNRNLEELNQKLLDAYNQCEENRESSAQLLSSKQQLEAKVAEQMQQINELHASMLDQQQLAQLRDQNHALQVENEHLQHKLAETEQQLSPVIQRVSSPKEVGHVCFFEAPLLPYIPCRMLAFIMSTVTKRSNSYEPI